MQHPHATADTARPVGMKRIGELFVESGLLSEEDLQKGLDYSKKTALPLGRVLVMLRLANDADLRAVLHVQQLMKFESMPGNFAVRALTYMRENKVHIEWACKQVGWESDKFKKDLPPALRDIKEQIADAESKLGADHGDVAVLMLQLVDFYQDEKMWAHAESTAEQALQKLERAFGDTDLRVADGASKFSDLLFMQDRYEESLAHAQRALQICQKTLGEDNRRTGSALRALAEIHDVQRRFSEAERCYMQALEVMEKTCDIQDVEVLYLLRAIGYVCRRSGRTPDSVLVGTLLTESGMVAAEKVPEALAYSKENNVPMARALVMMDVLSEDGLRPALHAQLLIRSNLLPAALGIRALRICHKHGVPLESAMETIGWRMHQGRRYELTQLLQTHDQLLEAERTLPADDPEVGALCLRLADLFETYERYADAEPLFKRALSIMEKTDGNEESMTEILDRLAWVYVKQQKYDLADAIYRKVLEMRQHLFGDDHEEIIASYVNIGRLQVARADHTDAVIWFQKALVLAERYLDPKHPNVADIIEQLAFGFYEMGCHDRAEPLFWQAYKIKSGYMDVTSHEIVTLLTKLADMYNKDGKYTMADSVLVLFQENKSVHI